MSGPVGSENESLLEADLTWTGDRFEAGIQVEITSDGRLGRIGALARPNPARLNARALLPGFVNAHSHAFQRALRGHGERFPSGRGSFWSWREAMYGLVERLGPEEFFSHSVQAFREMLASGTTTVGEFHYFHHTQGTHDFLYDRLLTEAAREAGIRLALLVCYYRSGGVGQPLSAPQRRFATDSIPDFWAHVDNLQDTVDPDWVTLGVAPHSLRAATPAEIAELYGEASRRGLVFHLHMEEQQGEVEECRAAYARSPMRVLLDALPSMHGLTAVHCTHTDPDDMREYLARGGRVCVNPLTAGSLGDGIPTLDQVSAAGDRLCIGSDSNARISMLEEMRWLEYGQRLRSERRGILADSRGQVASALLRAATRDGGASVGAAAGVLAPGAWADLITIDLDAPALRGWDKDSLLESIVFGAGDEVIDEVMVGGRVVNRGEEE